MPYWSSWLPWTVTVRQLLVIACITLFIKTFSGIKNYWGSSEIFQSTRWHWPSRHVPAVKMLKFFSIEIQHFKRFSSHFKPSMVNCFVGCHALKSMSILRPTHIYRPCSLAKQGDNALGSVRPSVRPSALSHLNRLIKTFKHSHHDFISLYVKQSNSANRHTDAHTHTDGTDFIPSTADAGGKNAHSRI